MKNNKLVSQIVKFGIVGLIAAAVDVGTLTVLTECVHMDVLSSSAVAFCVSVVVNYILSMRFVFRGKKQSRVKEFIIFVLLSIGGLGINQLIMWIGVDCMDVYYLAVKIFAMIFVPVYNFITRKIFLEKRQKRGAQDENLF